MITISDLCKSFKKKEVLAHLDLHIPHAGIYAILGKNGAGKTTLFRILSGLEHPDSGKIVLNGKIGYLPTEQFFYPRILGKEYLEFSLHAQKLPTKNYDKYNSLFDLPLHKQVNTYSSGMKKKLGIMSILLQENDILLLDEPYNGLDIESVMLVGKIMETLAENGKTIILSSHILSSITDITSNIFYLNNGVLSDYSNRKIDALKEALLDGSKLRLVGNVLGSKGAIGN